MTSFAVLVLVKATLVCGVAFLLSYLCRRTRASIRHLLFALAFTALVAIPGVSLISPTVAVTVPGDVTTSVPRLADTAATVLSSGGPSESMGSGAVSRPPASIRSFTIAEVIVAMWLIGVALCLVPVVVGSWQIHRLRQVASPWFEGQAMLQNLAPAVGVHRPTKVLLHDVVWGPMTCGVLKPAIILPLTAVQWDEATCRHALRHELEHVARWDVLTHNLTRVICAAYWLHPCVWAAWQRLRLESERACDDAVLRKEDAKDYAALLVSMAQRQGVEQRRVLLAMAGRDDLAARVAAVLDDSQARGRVGRRWATALIVAGAMVIFGIAPITVVRATPQLQATSLADPPLIFETASLTRNRGNARSLMYLTEDINGTPGVGSDSRVQWMIASNMTARHLVWFAYGFQLRSNNGGGGLHQIQNVPEWVDSDRFDLVAKAPSRATPEQMQQMMQSLLAERFAFVAHHQLEEFPIYALVVSRRDGMLGPRMTPSHVDCRYNPGASSACGLSGGRGRLEGRGVTTAQLVKTLPNHLSGSSQIAFDRRVVDETSLSGAFDLILEWPPDPVAHDARAPQGQRRLLQHRFFALPLELRAPNFLVALREQLGLRFNNQLAPEPVLVIDKIEPPIE